MILTVAQWHSRWLFEDLDACDWRDRNDLGSAYRVEFASEGPATVFGYVKPYELCKDACDDHEAERHLAKVVEQRCVSPPPMCVLAAMATEPHGTPGGADG